MSIDVKALKDGIDNPHTLPILNIKKTTFKGHTNHIFNIAISIDKKVLVSASYDGTIQVRSLINNIDIDKAIGQANAATTTVAKASEMGEVIRNFQHDAAIDHMCLAKDDDTIIFSDVNGRIYVYFIKTENCSEIYNEKTKIACLKLGTNGDTLIWSCNNKINVYSLKKGWVTLIEPKYIPLDISTHPYTFKTSTFPDTKNAMGYTPKVLALAQNNECIAYEFDTHIKIYSLKLRREIQVLKSREEAESIEYMEVAADGDTIVAGYKNSTVSAWSIKSGQCLFSTQNRNISPIRDLCLIVKAICLLEDNDTIVVGWLDGKVGIYSLKNRKCLFELTFNNIIQHMPTYGKTEDLSIVNIIQCMRAFRQGDDLCMAAGSSGYITPFPRGVASIPPIIDFRVLSNLFASRLNVAQSSKEVTAAMTSISSSATVTVSSTIASSTTIATVTPMFDIKREREAISINNNATTQSTSAVTPSASASTTVVNSESTESTATNSDSKDNKFDPK